MIKPIEIMAPVGSYESLQAAIQGGANAVYFGVGTLNMRSRSSANFSLDDLTKISTICKQHNLRSYLTLNTIVYDSELEEVYKVADAAKAAGITAVIASDLAVLEYLKKIRIETHISTQCNITNIESVRFFSRYADVMVTARELSLEQVKAITRKIEEQQIKGPSGELVQIEIFAHGALCMAISGKCYISLDNFGYSANKGACLQPCRRSYDVKDTEHELELRVENKYIMSPKDLCTMPFIDKIIDAGVRVLKIEGRGRSADYVKTVTQCYSEAADAVLDHTFTKEKTEAWMSRLSKVYNRGFWDGYYLGRKVGEWTAGYGSSATHKKVYIGKVTNFFTRVGAAEIKIETGGLKVGDEYVIMGPTTGVCEGIVEEIRTNLIVVESAQKGDVCSIIVPLPVRRNDKLYKMVLASE